MALPGDEETIRGHSGAALLVLDEASRIPDVLYKAVRPILAVSGGTRMALSTPFGARMVLEGVGKSESVEAGFLVQINYVRDYLTRLIR